MPEAVSEKVLITVFDGLRRDHVTPERMPRLAAFMQGGFDVKRSRSVFPSATRVNASAFSTGAPPVVNGLVGNKFYDPALHADGLIDTSDLKLINAIVERSGRPFLAAPSLGEALAAHGRTMGVWSAASRGTTYFTHPKALELGHVRVNLHAIHAGEVDASDFISRYGPVPDSDRPNTKRMDYLASIWCDVLERGLEPDVSLIWFNDPDLTYHYKGIESAESRAALAGVDAAFGRILDTIEARGQVDRFNIVTLSDHGQIVARERVDMRELFRDAGISFATSFGDGVEAAGLIATTGLLRLRDSAALARVAAFLNDQPFIDAVFTRGTGGAEGIVPGTLAIDLLMAGHGRAPDLYYLMKSDLETTHGVPGGTQYLAADIPEGGGVHGGLNQHEINNVLALNGPRLKTSAASMLPGGIIDVAPTVLHLMGIAPPVTMFGRPLVEAIEGEGARFEERESVAEVEANGRRITLTRHHMGRTTYIGGLSVK